METRRIIQWANLLNKGVGNAISTIKELNTRRDDVLETLRRLASKGKDNQSAFVKLAEEYALCVGTDDDERKENRKTLRGLAHRLGRGANTFSQLFNTEDIRAFIEDQTYLWSHNLPVYPLSFIKGLVQIYGKQINPLLKILAQQAQICQSYLAKQIPEASFVKTLQGLREQENALYSRKEREEMAQIMQKVRKDMQEYQEKILGLIEGTKDVPEHSLGSIGTRAMLSCGTALAFFPAILGVVTGIAMISEGSDTQSLMLPIGSLLIQIPYLKVGLPLLEMTYKEDVEPMLDIERERREYKEYRAMSVRFEKALSRIGQAIETV